MPIFLPSIIMKNIPSTMSFLYHVGGEIEHTPEILSDPINSEQWSTLTTLMTEPHSWDEYTSTIKNIRVYKGILSTITFINHVGARIKYSHIIEDDATTSEEWSTITHFMTPQYSWESYVSTMNIYSKIDRFHSIEKKVWHDLSIADYVFNNINISEVPNVSEWVIYKRNLLKLLSTPSAIIKDYDTTLNIYPIQPSISNSISTYIGSNF